jgi:glycosyltransferase involved in cell wall biosynthesis
MHTENVAFLLDSAPRTWSSQEDRHLRLCQALAARGSRPVLVFATELPPEIERRFAAGGVEVTSINYAHGVRHYYRELGKLVERYSITTAHIIFFDYFSAIPWIARLRGVKWIIYEMQNGGVAKSKSWKRNLLRLRTRGMTQPMRLVIAISEFIKRQLVEAGLDEKKIVVRHLGIDNERFVPDPQARRAWAEKFSIAPDETILSTVSYLRPIKNPQTIVEACGLLAERGVPVRLIVAGDGEMLEELQELSRRLGIADRTHWLGLCLDPSSLLQASDLFLLATVGEAFGLVLAEAMACGVPVVGSRSAGIMEVVADNETGLLVTPLDPAAFADAIERLAKDVELRRKMGRQGVERVRQHFTVDRAVEETIRIYESLWAARA